MQFSTKMLKAMPNLSELKFQAKFWKSKRRNSYEKNASSLFLPLVNRAWQRYLLQKYPSILHFETSVFRSNFQHSATHILHPIMRGTSRVQHKSKLRAELARQEQ